MKILVVGSGGREHALVWKISQSPQVEKIYCAPGNGGIAGLAECVGIKADNIEALLDFALQEKIDLTVVGPEVSLALGIVDLFQSKGLKIFGPSKAASRLEASKIFAKNIMKKYNIPTAEFEIFSDYGKAIEFVRVKNKPQVIKADGLCAGKGVFVCSTLEEQEAALKEIMQDKAFGIAGATVLIEEMLVGEEASILAVSDGENVIVLDSSQDHKRIFDDDQGPNTGGMGAYSPAPVVTKGVLEQIKKEVIIPLIKGMKEEGCFYSGILYAGIMLTVTGPKVLEFNVRFGDPETQAVLPRLKGDIVEIMNKTLEQKLSEVNIEWDPRACVCVVIASGGYPGDYEKGKVISGLDSAEKEADIVIFHAGTKKDGDTILTSGGRVLGVTGLGASVTEAIEKTYVVVDNIQFDRIYFRRDIGKKALARIT
ncbi:MAG: phosphoribosylamine--glycine ligase [PVC group bacterium]|nr:phosphoribosylamine--glycine ligase [PVC group bacterium]